jgi:hypothetical protein
MAGVEAAHTSKNAIGFSAGGRFRRGIFALSRELGAVTRHLFDIGRFAN